MKISVIGLRGFPLIEGGVERHCESLYPKMSRDFNITVYRRKPYVKSDGLYDHITFIDLPSTKIKGVEPFFHSFISSVYAAINKPDVVHYHNIGPALFSPIVKMRKIPMVLTYHSANYEHKKWGGFARKLLKLSERIALKNADRVIFVNRFQMEKFDATIRKKSVFIPNGINEMSVSSSTSFLEKIGVEKEKYILSVGRITQEKGFDVLIRAFKNADITGIKLVIAGGVEFENDYMKELQKIGADDVIFTGAVYGEDLYQLYTHARLFVLASNSEGFPLVLLEAMSYGLNVLVSDIPAMHLVTLGKDDYFECGNYRELSEKITDRIKTSTKRKYDIGQFDWNKIAIETGSIYCQVSGKTDD